MFGFETAMIYLRQGDGVRLVTWPKGEYIVLRPDEWVPSGPVTGQPIQNLSISDIMGIWERI